MRNVCQVSWFPILQIKKYIQTLQFRSTEALSADRVSPEIHGPLTSNPVNNTWTYSHNFFHIRFFLFLLYP